MDKNLQLEREHSDGSGYLCEEQGTSSSLDPAPSSLPLQGGKGFTRSSSKLSSLEGVWLPRKCQENERKRE